MLFIALLKAAVITCPQAITPPLSKTYTPKDEKKQITPNSLIGLQTLFYAYVGNFLQFS